MQTNLLQLANFFYFFIEDGVSKYNIRFIDSSI